MGTDGYGEDAPEALISAHRQRKLHLQNTPLFLKRARGPGEGENFFSRGKEVFPFPRNPRPLSGTARWKKLFFFDTPAQGALTGITLLIASVWILPGLTGLYFFYCLRVLFCVWGLLFVYALILRVRFGRCELAACRRHWLLAAARGGCTLLFIACFLLLDGCLAARYGFVSGPVSGIDGALAKIAGPMDPLIPAAAGILFLAASYLLTARLYARAAEVPFAKVFNVPTKILLVLLLFSYFFFLGGAAAASRRTERTVRELEQHFGRPLSAAGLRELYLRNRKSDERFWKRAKELTRRIQAAWKDIDFYLDAESGAFTGTFPPEFLRRYRQVYESMKPLFEREKMFDSLPPADGAKRFVPGDLLMEDLSETQSCRDLCRTAQWRIRFAAEDNDLPAAYAALARMKNVSKYLESNPAWTICTLVMCATEAQRVDAMLWLAGNAPVPDDVLAAWRKDLLDCDRDLERINFEALYAEAVSMDDVCRRFAVDRGLSDLRFIFPQAWRFAAADRNLLLNHFKVKKSGDMKEPDFRRGFLSSMLYPNGEGIQRWFDQLSARYRGAAALLGAELEKRRTGRYPDALETPPADPFTGKPMLCRKGLIPVPEFVWDGAKKQFKPPVIRQKEGVAVWSVGSNHKNDGGLNKLDGGPSKSDDVRVFLLIPSAPKRK